MPREKKLMRSDVLHKYVIYSHKRYYNVIHICCIIQCLGVGQMLCLI